MAAVKLTPAGGLQVGDVPEMRLAFSVAGEPLTVSLAEVTVRVRPDHEAATTVAPSDLSLDGREVCFRWKCAAGGRHHVHAEWASGDNGAGVDGYFDVTPDPTLVP